jgi:arginine decarboxylase
VDRSTGEAARIRGKPVLHGAVLETIMASVNGHLGERLCAGVGTVQVKRKSDDVHIGGFAAEYEGYADTESATKVLHGSLKGIVERRNTILSDDDRLVPFDEKIYVKDFFVEKNYGTVLVAICFIYYIYPLAEKSGKDPRRI